MVEGLKKALVSAAIGALSHLELHIFEQMSNEAVLVIAKKDELTQMCISMGMGK